MATNSWSSAELIAVIRRGCEGVLELESFAHHLAKASVERWFAFELAAQLDRGLEERGWVALVECGGVQGELGNFDLLLVPRSAARTRERARLGDTWPADAIAIELKAAHLADGGKGRTHGLLEDLTQKPKRAEAAGRGCAVILGILITTSGFGKDMDGQATKERAARIAETLLAPGIQVVERIDREVAYQGWAGHVWVEIVASAPVT